MLTPTLRSGVQRRHTHGSLASVAHSSAGGYVLAQQFGQPSAPWQRADLTHRACDRRSGGVHDREVPLRPGQRRVDEWTGHEATCLRRQHDHYGRELRALRAVNGDRPAVQEIGERLALDLRGPGRELDGHDAGRVDVVDDADLAVRIAERLRLEMVGGRDYPVTRVEATLAGARVERRL